MLNECINRWPRHNLTLNLSNRVKSPCSNIGKVGSINIIMTNITNIFVRLLLTMDYSILHENIIIISLINISFAFLQSCPCMRLSQINTGLLWEIWPTHCILLLILINCISLLPVSSCSRHVISIAKTSEANEQLACHMFQQIISLHMQCS